MGNAQSWIVVIGLAVGTFLIRYSFIGLFAERDMPHWLERSLKATEVRLAAVRPDIDRLDQLHAEALRDAAYLEASRPAFQPARTPLPLLSGLARALPPGVRFLTLQMDSPPGDSGWSLRADARLDDWRGVPVLVDSLRRVQGVDDVRVGSQQRQQEKVHLVVNLVGRWP